MLDIIGVDGRCDICPQMAGKKAICWPRRHSLKSFSRAGIVIFVAQTLPDTFTLLFLSGWGLVIYLDELGEYQDSVACSQSGI